MSETKIYISIFIGAVLLIILAVLVYTARPYDTYACLHGHYVPHTHVSTNCTKVGKSSSCSTSVYVTNDWYCDVYSQPTVNPGWMYKH